MGHIHLGVLPKTRKWREVVEQLSDGAADLDIVAATAIAAERDLLAAASDPGFVETVYLLAVLPGAARSENLGEALRSLHLSVPDHPDLFGLITALGDKLDRTNRRLRNPNDFRDLSRRALLSTVTASLGDRLPTLLSVEPADVRAAARKLSAPREFARFARSFFTRLLGETLRYWLDRALSAHTGPGMRFASAGERSQFDRALMQYCLEATFIIEQFSAGWYGKTLYRDGRITSHTAAAYGAVALRKISAELRLKQTDA